MSAKESACVHVHGKSWHQCRVSHSLAHTLSLSVSFTLLSLTNQNYPGIFSESVGKSICVALISNLSRSFSFGRSAHRFDTIILDFKILGSTKAQQQEV